LFNTVKRLNVSTKVSEKEEKKKKLDQKLQKEEKKRQNIRKNFVAVVLNDSQNINSYYALA
jgi:GMP synthase PP-ATPase subunit